MSNGQQAGGRGGAGKEQLSAVGAMIVKSQTLDGEGKEMVRLQFALEQLERVVLLFRVRT